MKKLFVTFGLALALLILPLNASASREIHFEEYFNNFPKSKEHAQKLVTYCWDISEEQRANPNLDIIDQGHTKTAKCLEDHYINLLLSIAPENAKTKAELSEQFKNLKTNYNLISTDIAYAGNDFRPPMAHNFETNVVNVKYSMLVEKILMDLIYQIHRVHDPDFFMGDFSAAMDYMDNVTP